MCLCNPYRLWHIAEKEGDLNFKSLKVSKNTVCKEQDTQLNKTAKKKKKSAQDASSNGYLGRRNMLDLGFLLRYVILHLSGKQTLARPVFTRLISSR